MQQSILNILSSIIKQTHHSFLLGIEFSGICIHTNYITYKEYHLTFVFQIFLENAMLEYY